MDELFYGPVNDPSAYSSGSGIDWSGFGGTLVDLAKVYGGVEIQKAKSTPMYAIGQNGQPYVNGQRAYKPAGISPLLLLLIAGGLFIALKD